MGLSESKFKTTSPHKKDALPVRTTKFKRPPSVSVRGHTPPTTPSRIFRPSAPIPKGGEGEYLKLMKNLGFKKAHTVEGANAWFTPAQKTKYDIFKKYAMRHAGKAANVVKAGGVLGGAATAGANLFTAVTSTALAAAAVGEGVNALKHHSEQKMNRLAQERKYGTIDAATKTRKRLQERNQ